MGHENVLVIGEQSGILTADIASLRVIPRPMFPFSEDDSFLRAVSDWFASRAEGARQIFSEEPERLLEVSPRAAVVSAITLLEIAFRMRLGSDILSSAQPVSLGKLARVAMSREIVTSNDYEEIQSWLRTRNAAVHTARSISRAEAERIIRGVRELIARLGEPPIAGVAVR